MAGARSDHPPTARTETPARQRDREHEQAKLTELLNETRILLPGTEVFLGFLATLPFSQQFGQLDAPRRVVYVCTFFSTLLALVLFVVPAAYHRLARPIRHKQRFKVFANRFLVAGLVPMSVAMVLAAYLVSSVVIDGVAIYFAAAIALLIAAVWWIVPMLRMHDRVGRHQRRRQPSERPFAAPARGHDRIRAAAEPRETSTGGA